MSDSEYSVIKNDVIKRFDCNLYGSCQIIRDFLTAFWLSPKVSTGDPIISPRHLARGLIMVKG